MARHRGGKVGAAGKALVKKSSSKAVKTKAAKTLNKHKQEKH